MPAYGGPTEAERLRRYHKPGEPDYSRSRHTHPDDVNCAEAGPAGHSPWHDEKPVDEAGRGE